MGHSGALLFDLCLEAQLFIKVSRVPDSSLEKILTLNNTDDYW